MRKEVLDAEVEIVGKHTPEDIEYIVGKLLLVAAEKRAARNTDEDKHEIAHLYMAVLTGNSDGCKDGVCVLTILEDE